METPRAFKNRASICGDTDFSMMYDEEKIIEEATTTPFEKVLRILGNLKNFISGIVNNSIKVQINPMVIISDLDWVIKRIQSHTLYTYDLSGENEEFEKLSQESPEIKTFLEFLSDYSENKDKNFPINNLPLKKSDTLNFYKIDSPDIQTPSTIRRGYTPMEINKIFKQTDDEIIIPLNKANLTERNEFPVIAGIGIIKKESVKESENSPKGKLLETYRSADKRLSLGSLRQMVVDGTLDDNSTKIVGSSKSMPTNNDSDNMSVVIPIDLDLEIIFKKEFNVHDFEKKVLRANVIPIVGKALYQKLNLMEIINCEKLDRFLKNISDGYIPTVAYHNSIHAADIAQTAAIYLMNSNLEEIAFLNNNDILALITACLAHDIGHPGTNNGYQVNTYSDIAIMYNDLSVLENYHTSTFFNIVKKTECNIFDKFIDTDYRQFRKRVIGLILSTDMASHAKIHTLMRIKSADYKEKVRLYKLEHNVDVVPTEIATFVSLEPKEFFEEQQKILDYIIHTADLSHNSKSFKISEIWTALLMEEFWDQGDVERNKKLPISFLCDRTTAEVPKSQIGFIKGIIIPSFDVLIDILPGLAFLREEIDKNLEEWGKLAEEKKIVTPRKNRTPMNTTKISGNNLSVFGKFTNNALTVIPVIPAVDVESPKKINNELK